MTSVTNDAETKDFFESNNFFGLGSDSVHFFVQGRNPIVDADGKLLLAEEDSILMGPDGHGGTFDALHRSGLLDALRSQGKDLISYFQVDNPLVTVADPRFIGYHIARDVPFSCKVLPKRDPEEGLGIAVMKGDQPAVLEYIDIPPEVAAERLPNGRLRFLHGSIAIHIISVPFAERVLNEDPPMPWHVAKKQYEIINDKGQKILAAPGSCHKFERFIFDAIAYTQRCAFVEVRREMEFGPVKSAEGEDSPDTARRLMQRKWLEWLLEAGALARMPRDTSGPLVEISPLYAMSPEELKQKLEPDWSPSFPVVLEP
jgi:UDP-N-acetylglucosamine/UDP-N-acetylgalactosamine diphosphorylase